MTSNELRHMRVVKNKLEHGDTDFALNIIREEIGGHHGHTRVERDAVWAALSFFFFRINGLGYETIVTTNSRISIDAADTVFKGHSGFFYLALYFGYIPVGYCSIQRGRKYLPSELCCKPEAWPAARKFLDKVGMLKEERHGTKEDP